jgi:hypothetical protein
MKQLPYGISLSKSSAKSNKRVNILLDKDHSSTGWHRRITAWTEIINELDTYYSRTHLASGFRLQPTEYVLFLPDLAARFARGKLSSMRLHCYPKALEAQEREPTEHAQDATARNLNYVRWLAKRLRHHLIDLFNPVAVTGGGMFESWWTYAQEHPCFKQTEVTEGHGIYPSKMAHEMLNDPNNYLVIRRLGAKKENWARAGIHLSVKPSDVDPAKSEVSKALVAVFWAWRAIQNRGKQGFAAEGVGLEFDENGFLVISWPKFLASTACPEVLRTDLTIPNEIAHTFIQSVNLTEHHKRRRGTMLFDCSKATVGNHVQREKALQLGIVKTDELNEALEQWSLLDMSVLLESQHWFTETYNIQRKQVTASNKDKIKKLAVRRNELYRSGLSAQEIQDSLVAEGLLVNKDNITRPTH